MDWLPNLLKHLKIARSGVFAAFVTAGCFIFIPKLIPDLLKSLPGNWNNLAIAAFLFSGCLLLIWLSVFLSKKIALIFNGLIISVKSKSLSDLEIEMLLAMANNPTEPLNLIKINYQNLPFTHLDLLQISSSLNGKGLVTINSWDSNLVSLSNDGQKRAHQLQKQISNNQNS